MMMMALVMDDVKVAVVAAAATFPQSLTLRLRV